MSTAPDTRIHRVDRQVLMIAGMLTTLVFLPMVVLGVVMLLAWRLLRGALVGRLATVSVLLAAVVAALLPCLAVLMHHDNPLDQYVTAQSVLYASILVHVTAVPPLPGWGPTDYLRGVAPLSAPGALLGACILGFLTQSPPLHLDRREATGIIVSRGVQRRAQRGLRHPHDGWGIGYRADGKLVDISDREARLHAIICEATGSGKTTIIRHLVEGIGSRQAVVIIDCKASRSLRQVVEAIPNSVVWTIGGTVRWDALRGDPTALANKLLVAEGYDASAAIYKAAAERYVQWVGLLLDATGEPHDPQRLAELLKQSQLARRLRELKGRQGGAWADHIEPMASRLAALGETELHGITGFATRFGFLVEGMVGRGLGVGPDALVIEDAIRAGRTVLFSLDAASYADVAAKLGAWVLLDLVRVAGVLQAEGWGDTAQAALVIDEFSALGHEGRHVMPVLARAREAGIACVVSTQGLADLSRIDRSMPQQVVQNTAVRIVLRQGSADDADQWARILGQYDREELARATDDLGRSTGSGSARWRRDWYVPPDELRVLGTGEAIVSVAPVHGQPPRLERVLVAQPGMGQRRDNQQKRLP